jgi:hypothetical protein
MSARKMRLRSAPVEFVGKAHVFSKCPFCSKLKGKGNVTIRRHMVMCQENPKSRKNKTTGLIVRPSASGPGSASTSTSAPDIPMILPKPTIQGKPPGFSYISNYIDPFGLLFEGNEGTDFGADAEKVKNNEYAQHLVVKKTEKKGWALFTAAPIAEGDLITLYVGKVLGGNDWKNAWDKDYHKRKHHYCLTIKERKIYIDGYKKSNEARFMNHSCRPNAEMKRLCIDRRTVAAFFALRDIPAETELTWNYNFYIHNGMSSQKCECGESNCTGKLDTNK